MTLEQIRVNIVKDMAGMLCEDELRGTVSAISSFKSEFGYLPNDIDEWFDTNS